MREVPLKLDLTSRIVILTYDHPHRKTQDLLFRLMAYGYEHIILVATPWIPRKGHKAIFPHRPGNALPIKPLPLAVTLDTQDKRHRVRAVIDKNLGEFLSCESPDIVLIGGAERVPEEVTEKFLIVNSHPGIIPHVRGLDSLKWAILRRDPIGVTTHVINADLDAGWLVEQKHMEPDYVEDFGTFSRRQYELEVAMLADAPMRISEAELLEPVHTEGESMRRMSHVDEMRMMDEYENRRRALTKGSDARGFIRHEATESPRCKNCGEIQGRNHECSNYGRSDAV